MNLSFTISISLFRERAPWSNSSTCIDILPEEQAAHIEISPANSFTDSPMEKAVDVFSRLLPLGSGSWMNDGQITSLADNHQGNCTKRRDISEDSYPYRPTYIDVNPQHQTFLSFSLPSFSFPFTNNSPLVFNPNRNFHQEIEPIKKDEMPHDSFGNFIMNPKAPIFVPRQQGQLGHLGSRGLEDQPGILPLPRTELQGTYLTIQQRSRLTAHPNCCTTMLLACSQMKCPVRILVIFCCLFSYLPPAFSTLHGYFKKKKFFFFFFF